MECLAVAPFSSMSWTAIKMMSPYWSVPHFLGIRCVLPSVTTLKM